MARGRSRRKHYKRLDKEPHDLDLTNFLDLLVMMISFLLINAVFSRVNIMELDLPVSSGAAAAFQPEMSIEIMVRAQSLDVGNGQTVMLSIPKEKDKYDYKKLSAFLLELKAKVPNKDDATVLMEADIQYENLVHVMDAVRSAEIQQGGSLATQNVELFPNISVGDAP